MRQTALTFVTLALVACGTDPVDPYQQNPPVTAAPIICTAAEEGYQRCNTGHRLEQCLSGTWTLSINCDALAQNCVVTGANQAVCQPRDTSGLCSAAEEGQKRCTGTLVEYCNGSTWNGVVDCASLNQTCIVTGPGNGACDGGGTGGCTDTGEQRCALGDVLEQCNGTSWVTESDCGAAGEDCVVTGTGTAECEPPPGTCTTAENGYQRCTGTLLEQCDGADWNSVVNCSSTSQICQEDGNTASCEDPPSGCDYVGMTVGHELVRDDDANEFFGYTASTSESAPYDSILVQSYMGDPYNGPTGPGTYSLDGTNYSDCGLSVLGLKGCTAGEGCDKTFYADVGAVQIDAFDDTHFTGTFIGVDMKEVTIDPSTYVSTPVADGDLWCADGWSFDHERQPTSAECVTGGTGVMLGDNIANFQLQNCNGDWVELHSNCGVKAMWFVLAAGWCSACAEFVPQVASIMADNPTTLEAWVLLGEDASYAPVSLSYCQQYATAHSMDPANVFIDNNWDTFFNYVYGYLGDSIYLPWNALLRGTNMEYVYSDETGGDLNTTLNSLLNE